MGISWAAGMPVWTLANGFTPMMWATALHLAFGNLVIGVVEGLILAKVWRVGWVRAVGWMVVANYLSAFVGIVIVEASKGSLLQDANLNNVRWLFWGMVGLMFAATVVLEWPLVALILRRKEGWLSKSVKGSLLVQTVSYAVLFGWYGSASQAGLLAWNLEVVKPAEIRWPAGAVLYYIGAEDGAVKRRRMEGGEEETVYELKSSDVEDRLYVCRSKDGWDLMAWKQQSRSKQVRVLKGLAGIAAAELGRNGEEVLEPESWWWRRYAPPARLGDAERSPWRFEPSAIGAALEGQNKKTGASVNVGLDVPWIQWDVLNATHLPGDVVVFQLGGDQICVLEAERRRVALVARGRGPVVVLSGKGAATRPATTRAVGAGL